MSQDTSFHAREGQHPPARTRQPHEQQLGPSSLPPSNIVNQHASYQHFAFEESGLLPPGAMNTLAQMNLTPEQIMQIAQMISSGAITLNGTPAAAPAQIPPSAPMPHQAMQLHPFQQPFTSVVESNGRDIDVDEEEGEVKEDGEVEESTKTSYKPSGFLTTPPKGPRNRPQNGTRSPMHSAAASRRSSAFDQLSSAKANAPIDASQAPRADRNGTTAQTIQQNEQQPRHDTAQYEECKDFLVEMHANGYTYEDVSTYFAHAGWFQRLWDSTGLPRTAPDIQTAMNQSQVDSASKVEETRPPPAPVRRVQTQRPVVPQDRAAYIRKLEAAKIKNTESAPASKTPPQPQAGGHSSQTPKPQAAPAFASQQPSSQASQLGTPQPEASQPPRRLINKDLVKQRLAKLNAERAQQQAIKENAANAEGNEVAPAVTAPHSGNATGNGEAFANALGPGDGRVPTIAQRSDLPGLFTSGAPPMSSPHWNPLTATYQFGQRPSSAVAQAGAYLPQVPQLDHPNTTPRLIHRKRPFGLSRTASEDERIVITNSDNESDDDGKVKNSNGIEMERQELTSAPMNAYPPTRMVPKGSTHSTAAHPGTPTEQDAKIAEMKRRIALLENRKMRSAANSTAEAGLDTGAPSTPISASEVGTPLTDQAVGQMSHDAAPPLEASIAREVLLNAAGSIWNADGDLSFDEVQSEAPLAHATPLSLQDVVEQVQGPQSTVEEMQAETFDTSNAFSVSQQKSVNESQAQPSISNAAHEQDDDTGDMEIDDDDMDDIYDDPAPPIKPVAPVASTAQAGSDALDEEDDDDSDVAMDTSSESSDELRVVYGLTDRPAESRATPLPLPLRSPSPVPVPKDLDSVDHITGLTADNNVVEALHDDQVADELAPELQPSEEELAVPADQASKKFRFTPYTSPLSIFRDFRYHPEYLASVPGGYKSMSYNHKIDPDKVICPYETAGGICNDKTCEFQHFRAMGLSDNELLKLMGADQIPAKLPQDVRKWKAGLSALISKIRDENKASDVATISSRIAEYRREFVGDPTKTLLLD